MWNCHYKGVRLINVYTSHVYKREDILRHEQTFAVIIELNHGVAGFGNDEKIKYIYIIFQLPLYEY